MKALVAFAKDHPMALRAGTLVVRREGAVVGELAFSSQQQDALVIDGLEKKLSPGNNRLVLSLTGGNRMAYTLAVEYRTAEPPTAGPLRLSVQFDPPRAKFGQTVRMTARLSNCSDRALPAIAILGLPGLAGFSVDQLEDLKRQGNMTVCVDRTPDVICCWRRLQPGATVVLHLKLTFIGLPGRRYTAPASQARLLEDDDLSVWAKPVEIEIDP
jgi:hypothetical protein